MTATCCRSASPFLRKPLHVVRQQQQSHGSTDDPGRADATGSQNDNSHRHLSLLDLLFIGVGGTVGSGLFVLTGQIAAHYSGSSTWISFLLAGAAATTSGLCFAELSGRLPLAGSTYVYAYVCLGELAAVLAAACLTLEYAVSGAAVARSWGDKVQELYHGYSTVDQDDQVQLPGQDAGSTFVNLPAFAVSSGATLLLLAGVHESKAVTNAITAFKMLIVAFMIVGGLVLFQGPNMKPSAPYGARGVLRGATTSFFGYLGFDEVCCVASEALHPERDMPRAVLGTLVIVTICYVMASLALTGMLPFDEISATSGFPAAFYSRGISWAGTLTAVGEILTLPVVVIISLMAQPRLTYSLAVDGLLPTLFAKLNDKGNMVGGTAAAGIGMTILATFVPFTYLNDLVSAGILVAFCMTCSCLVMLRCESPSDHAMEYSLASYNAFCFVSSVLWTHDLSWLPWQRLWAILSTTTLLLSLVFLTIYCPRTNRFGGTVLSSETAYALDSSETYFQTPLVPYVPCIGIAINWYLIAQLDAWGIFLLVFYLGAAATLYLWKCASGSVGHQFHWSTTPSYQCLSPIDSNDQVELQDYSRSTGSESIG